MSCSASATILSCEGGSGPVACTVFKTGGRGDEPRRWVRLPCALAGVRTGKIASALRAAIRSPPALGCAASSSVSNQRAERLRCLSSEAGRHVAVGVQRDLDRAVAEQARHHLRVHPLAEE